AHHRASAAGHVADRPHPRDRGRERKDEARAAAGAHARRAVTRPDARLSSGQGDGAARARARPAMTALLGSHEARIDVRGAVLLDGLTFESRGDALGLVGGWEPLFALAAGRAQLAAGTLAIRGVHPQHGVRDGRIGLALAEITFPEGWNALDWLVQSAELAG